MKKIVILILKSILILISLFIILTTGKDVLLKNIFNEDEITVPNVLNINKDEAINILTENNLKYEILSSRTDSVPSNVVFIQSPEANSVVKANRTIQLWINNNTDSSLDILIGMDLVEARRILNEKNIDIDRIDYISVNDSSDKVLSTYIIPNNSNRQRISLLVSSKNIFNETVMPDIIGLTFENAEKKLADMGLNISNIEYNFDESKPLYTILVSYPVAGDNIIDNNINVIVNAKNSTKKSIDDIIEESLKEIKNKDNDINDIINDTLNELNDSE